MRILTIGDIHGREVWKNFIFGSHEKYEDWAIEAQGEYFRPWEEVLDLRVSDIDLIVFVGDYFDSFDINNVDMKRNAEQIFAFKRAYPDRVVLLWGNHDVSYYDRSQWCSGFRAEMFFDFNELLNANRGRIQLAHQIGNVLWTHAGITKSYYENVCCEYAKRVRRGDEEMPLPEKSNLAEFLNEQFLHNWSGLFYVGRTRGGSDIFPGPLWADRSDLMEDPLPEIFQFVGHTRVEQVHGTQDEISGVCFLDCLGKRWGKVVIVEIQEGKYVNYEVLERE